jgi:hypothetical protein
MEDETIPQSGLVDLINRVLKQALRNPRFKATLNVFFNSIDSESAPDLIRTLFWEDPGIILSLIGAFPALVNTLIEALNEAGAQFNSMPTVLVLDFLEPIVSGLDGRKLGEAAGNVSLLVSKMRSDKASKLKSSTGAFAAAFRAGYQDRAGSHEGVGAGAENWMALALRPLLVWISEENHMEEM